MEAETEAPLAALNAIIRAADAPRRMREDLAAFLREVGVADEDLASMMSVGAERMLVYRSLVHNRIRHAIRDFLPRTLARRGRKAFAGDLVAFMEARAARSFYLRDVPGEFVDWVGPRWTADPEAPAYLLDLARHELLAIDVRNDPRGGEPATGLPLALDRPLRFDTSARRIDYAHAVHLLSDSKDDRSAPPSEPTRLLVYRDENHKVRYLELTPYAAAVLDELMVGNASVQGGLQRACASLGHPLDDDKLATAAQLLADLADRGVMLGAEPK